MLAQACSDQSGSQHMLGVEVLCVLGACSVRAEHVMCLFTACCVLVRSAHALGACSACSVHAARPFMLCLFGACITPPCTRSVYSGFARYTLCAHWMRITCLLSLFVACSVLAQCAPCSLYARRVHVQCLMTACSVCPVPLSACSDRSLLGVLSHALNAGCKPSVLGGRASVLARYAMCMLGTRCV